MFFEEMDSNCYLKLILTPVFRELTGKEGVQDNSHCLQVLNGYIL
jgi:hypothetical protein